ncbi:MAG: LLM class F420-dependent oxidoreductase [Acidimicrobiales bacterium]|nr:LLM class F420-dependent oxidoreductase [Acidimicrobiales bacterium]
MKFSVTYPLITHPSSPELMTREAVSRFARTAEDSGFNGIGFTDHPAPTDKWLKAGGHDALDPFVALTFCAAVTERIRLIPNIVVLPYRHPLIVAKMVATLAMLSEGRFTLAVATGYLRGEYRGLGIDFEERNALFDQAIDVLRGIWTRDDFSFEGAGIDAKGLTANPKPNTAPPIWIGGNSRQSRRRVARYGDGWTPFPAPRSLSGTTKTPPLESLEDLTVMLDELWQFLDEEGRARSDIDVAFSTPAGGRLDEGFDAEAHMAALDELAKVGVTWVGVSVPSASLSQALEALEHYGSSVIAPHRS